MNRQDAEQTVARYLKPVFGFALKRCRTPQDAEDLTQEIILRAFRALVRRDDIADEGKFIWTVAHNALSNYYRDRASTVIGVSLDEVAGTLSAPEEESDEAAERLRQEIAYLSVLQRKIVIAHYFENRKQADIARELGIPVGTVKWHLFEAKKELKRGMAMIRNAGELKFNPIRFSGFGASGSFGTKSLDDIFRSTLTQNICYCVRSEAKTLHEIADDLGVSPVYVEKEVEFLEEYGFLQAQKDRYIANFIIEEHDDAFFDLQDDMYRRAAEMFAGELYDELTGSGILDDLAIQCWQRSADGFVRADHNFLLWSLIPYIAALSGEKLMDDRIAFDEVATLRPDGAQNIVRADVMRDGQAQRREHMQLKKWCGPMWNGDGRHILWQIDTEWSDRETLFGEQYTADVKRVLSLYAREMEDTLSKDEYAYLAERGYVGISGDPDGMCRTAWQVVVLQNKEIWQRLLAIGDRIKEKQKAAMDALKAPYAAAVLADVPAHLKKAAAYGLQFVFYSDGIFLLHCINELLKDGRLKEPAESQRKALMTLIVKA